MAKKKLYTLVQPDNYGNYDPNYMYGIFATKKEAEAKLNEYKSKYGSVWGFVKIIELDANLIIGKE